MTNQRIDIPPAWDKIDLREAHGLLMVIGATDTGKSTFAQYLYSRLCADPGRRVAYLDGDPGQSRLGPPTTMTLALGKPLVSPHPWEVPGAWGKPLGGPHPCEIPGAWDKRGDDSFPPAGQYWRRFIQAISPRGHMLPLLVGAARLTQTSRDAGADVLVYDTSGWVGATDGGAHLKHAEIELLQPTVVFALQRDQELAPVLAPLQNSRAVQVVELRPSSAAQRRDVAARQAHRASQFAHYFGPARSWTVDWERLAVFPSPRFAFNQLVALEDEDGFTLALGMVELADLKAKRVTLRAPLASLDRVRALRLGDVTLDPKTFRDQPL